jgi:hypothetical protein
MASPDPSNGDWRELRRRERRARRQARWGRGDWPGPPLFALLLIVVGFGLLAQNFGVVLPQRWWALLLLVPALASLVAAIRAYRNKGPAPETWAAVISGIIFTLLALALFFGLDWGIFWPLLLVLLGAGILARGYWTR